MTSNFDTPPENLLRQEIVQVGKLLYDRGLIVGADGNISARLAKQTILITPSGLCKGLMTPDQLIIIDLEGRKIGPDTPANRHLKPTSETAMHLEVYKQRPDVLSVVHAHPPHAIALSIAGISLAECLLPEAMLFLGVPPTTPYSTPASQENALAIRAVIPGHDALLLERHGSLTVGDSPLNAYYRTETLEQVARIKYMLHQLGGGQTLPPLQVEKLMQIRQGMGLKRAADEADFCEICGVCHNQDTCQSNTQHPNGQTDNLVHIITQRVMQKLAEQSK